MADLGGVKAEEVAALIAENPEPPADAGSSALTRFVRRVSVLVENRGNREMGRIAVFLHCNALMDEIHGRQVIESPLIATGNDVVGNKVWLSNAVLGTAFALPYNCDDLGVLFQSLRDANLGAIGALVVDWRGANPVGRLYPAGIGMPDEASDVVFSDDRIAADDLKDCLDHFYHSSLRSPHLINEGHAVKIWENAAQGHPESRPEERIHGRLIDHLRSKYSRKTVRAEVFDSEGRVDLVIFSRSTDVAGRKIVLNHWVLELKALTDKTHNGNYVAPGVSTEAISKGVVQAIEYRDSLHAESAALCCYDMRTDDIGDDTTFQHVRADADDQGLLTWRWFLYRSVEAARQAGFGRRAINA